MPIILKKLKWSGVYSFSEREQTFEFKPGFYFLNGENGAGKSSFLNLITLVLFDKSPSLDKKDCIHEGAKSGKIKLEFSVDDVDYELEYIRTSKNFYWSLTRGGSPVITGAETGKYIEKLLGFNYNEFVSAFYLTQKSSFSMKLFYGDPSERLNILSHIFNLDRFLVASEKASERVKIIGAVINEMELALTNKAATKKVHEENLASPDFQNLKERIEGITIELGKKTTEFTQRDSQLQQELNDFAKASSETHSRRESISSRGFKHLKLENDSLNTLNKMKEAQQKYEEFITFKPDYEELLGQWAELKTLEKVKVDLNNSIAGDIVHYKSELQEIMGKIHAILIGEGKCDRCGSTVTAEQLDEYRKELLAQQEECQRGLDNLQCSLTGAKENLKGIQDEIARVDQDILRFKVKYADCIDGRIPTDIAAQVQIGVTSLERIHKELQDAKDEEQLWLKEKETLDQRGQELSLKQKDLHELDSQILKLALQKTPLEQKFREQETLQSTIATLTNEIQEIESKLVNANKNLTVNKFWVTGFKELGILRLTGYIDGVNEKMAELLESFGLRCWIDVLEAKKSAKDMFSLESFKRKVNLFVGAEGKKAVPLEGYSGGEQQLLCLAMVLSMGSVIGNINYLALDETFGSLDSSNRAKVLELLKIEKQRGLLAGACVLIISHDPEIKDGEAFDYIVKVQKGDDGSTLTVEED